MRFLRTALRPEDILQVVHEMCIRDRNYSYTDAPDGSYLCRYESYENGNLDSSTEQQFDALGACIYQAEYNRVGEMIYEMTAQTMDI